jgi:NAD(P)-dependent dehydrogenase (short-subunit alcohol dehydrogenase family)
MKRLQQPPSGVTEPGDISGRVYWVVGGSSGYGRVAADFLARHGASVIISSRRVLGSGSLGSLSGRLPGGGSIEYIPCDISREPSIRMAATALTHEFDRLDGCLVTAAMPNPACL